MPDQAVLTCEVDVKPGQKLELPQSLLDRVGPGHWRVTIQTAEAASSPPVRSHQAFLRSYAAEDEGLYDDYPAR